MYKSYRAYKPHPNYVNPNITNTRGVQFRVNISDPKTWKGTANSPIGQDISLAWRTGSNGMTYQQLTAAGLQ